MGSRFIHMVAIGAATAMALASNASADAAPERSAGTSSHSQPPVVYTTYESDATLVTVRPDGTAGRLLTPGAEPAWSPDGRWIAYTAPGYQQIWRIRPDGTGARRVVSVPDANATQATWSPDGRRLAFTVKREDIGGHEGRSSVAVWIARRDGSGAHRLRAGALNPTWSPSGDRIAFELRSGGVGAVRPDGGGFRTLVTGTARSPDFSPDGRRLLYLTPSESEFAPETVTSLNLPSGRERRIRPPMVGWAHDVTWTPDGRIAYLQQDWTREEGLIPGPSRLFTIRPDGTGKLQLAPLKRSALPGAGLSWRR